jgi:hypothetical protein
VLPTKLLGHEHENVSLLLVMHMPLFKHGFDKQGFDWHLFPTKFAGHAHE